MQSSSDTRPIPDPTVLTTAASTRLEEMLRNLIQMEITHQNDLFTERLLGLSRQLMTQFTMLEARTAEQKHDTTNALNTTLAAQKEAVAKSETATTERIRSVETLLATSTRAMDEKVSDIKNRVIAMEAVKLGTVEGAEAVRQGISSTQAIIASVVGVSLVLVTIGSIVIAILKP